MHGYDFYSKKIQSTVSIGKWYTGVKSRGDEAQASKVSFSKASQDTLKSLRCDSTCETLSTREGSRVSAGGWSHRYPLA